MLGLITDRTQSNVDRLKSLCQKGWNNMSSSEQIEWMGDPLTATAYGPVNLAVNGPYTSHTASAVFRNQYVTITATSDQKTTYIVVVLGDAADFEGKTMTFSVGSIEASGGGTPRLALYWHDSTGTDDMGIGLYAADSTRTFTVPENTNGRQYLAMRLYVASGTSVATLGDTVRYHQVMLEFGTTRHEYVPYTEIVATPTTKGAYNYSDLNRVERLVEELSEKHGLGLVTKTDWGQWDIMSLEDQTRYVENIQAIRSVYGGSVAIPEAPTSLEGMTFEKANNIEAIIQAVYLKDQVAILGSAVLGLSIIGE